MNAKRFVTLTLILALSLVCLLNHSVPSYPEGAWDLTTIATKSTLEATHIVVGEVTHVSFVFFQTGPDPLSIVTVRVDKDIKAEIERAASQATNPAGQVSKDDGVTPPGGLESEEDDARPETVSFIQVGGPWDDGGWVKAAGLPLLKEGDRVFLRLRPSNYPVRHNGEEYNSVTDAYGAVYYVQTEGDDIGQHVIKKSWQNLDVNVMDMTRIVRTTLEQPETMRTLEREVNGIWGTRTKEAHLQTIMDTVAEIEETLNLPAFDPDDQ